MTKVKLNKQLFLIFLLGLVVILITLFGININQTCDAKNNIKIDQITKKNDLIINNNIFLSVNEGTENILSFDESKNIHLLAKQKISYKFTPKFAGYYKLNFNSDDKFLCELNGEDLNYEKFFLNQNEVYNIKIKNDNIVKIIDTQFSINLFTNDDIQNNLEMHLENTDDNFFVCKVSNLSGLYKINANSNICEICSDIENLYLEDNNAFFNNMYYEFENDKTYYIVLKNNSISDLKIKFINFSDLVDENNQLHFDMFKMDSSVDQFVVLKSSELKNLSILSSSDEQISIGIISQKLSDFNQANFSDIEFKQSIVKNFAQFKNYYILVKRNKNCDEDILLNVKNEFNEINENENKEINVSQKHNIYKFNTNGVCNEFYIKLKDDAKRINILNNIEVFNSNFEKCNVLNELNFNILKLSSQSDCYYFDFNNLNYEKLNILIKNKNSISEYNWKIVCLNGNEDNKILYQKGYGLYTENMYLAMNYSYKVFLVNNFLEINNFDTIKFDDEHENVSESFYYDKTNKKLVINKDVYVNGSFIEFFSEGIELSDINSIRLKPTFDIIKSYIIKKDNGNFTGVHVCLPDYVNSFSYKLKWDEGETCNTIVNFHVGDINLIDQLFYINNPSKNDYLGYCGKIRFVITEINYKHNNKDYIINLDKIDFDLEFHNLFGDGDGTETNPYKIHNFFQLDNIRFAFKKNENGNIECDKCFSIENQICDYGGVPDSIKNIYEYSEPMIGFVKWKTINGSFNGKLIGNDFYCGCQIVSNEMCKNEIGFFKQNCGIIENFGILTNNLNYSDEKTFGLFANTNVGLIKNCTSGFFTLKDNNNYVNNNVGCFAYKNTHLNNQYGIIENSIYADLELSKNIHGALGSICYINEANCKILNCTSPRFLTKQNFGIIKNSNDVINFNKLSSKFSNKNLNIRFNSSKTIEKLKVKIFDGLKYYSIYLNVNSDKFECNIKDILPEICNENYTIKFEEYIFDGQAYSCSIKYDLYDLYGGGDGSPDNPFQIYNISQFDNLRFSNVKENNFNYILKNNLNFDKENPEKAIENFYGILDGDSYGLCIEKYHFSNNISDKYGIFLKNYGIIKNLGIKINFIYSGISNCGILVYNNYGVIENCCVICLTIMSYIKGEVGGIVYENSSKNKYVGAVKNSMFMIIISVNNFDLSLIAVKNNNNALIENCIGIKGQPNFGCLIKSNSGIVYDNDLYEKFNDTEEFINIISKKCRIFKENKI